MYWWFSTKRIKKKRKGLKSLERDDWNKNQRNGWQRLKRKEKKGMTGLKRKERDDRFEKVTKGW